MAQATQKSVLPLLSLEISATIRLVGPNQ